MEEAVKPSGSGPKGKPHCSILVVAPMALLQADLDKIKQSQNVILVNYNEMEKNASEAWARHAASVNGPVLFVTTTFDGLVDTRLHFFVDSLFVFAVRAPEEKEAIMKNFYMNKKLYFNENEGLQAGFLRK